MIEARKVNKFFGTKQVLKNVSLSINQGEITVLIGPSGSGKTTLLNCLSLISNPSSGEIIYDSDIHKFPNRGSLKSQFKKDNQYRPYLGFVFQDLHLLPHWTNYENIIYPIEEAFGSKERKRLDFLINLLEMEDFIHKYPNECSKGEEQRIAITRAVMLNPRYLLLDEITSAIDPEISAKILNYLIKLKDENVGIVLITHFLVFAQNVADKVVFIDHGQIIEEGSKNILQSPGTKRLQDFLLSLGGVIFNKSDLKVSDIIYPNISENELLTDLLDQFRKNPEVKEKLRIIYRVLDVSDIPNSVQHELYETVIKNWDMFVEDLFHWLGVKDPKSDEAWSTLLNYVTERLSNSKYPDHKAWIYLISLNVHPDFSRNYKSIEFLLNEYRDSPLELNQKVAINLINSCNEQEN